MVIAPLQYKEEPTVKNDILEQVPFIDGSTPVSAINPFQNLRNRYYGILQSMPIGRTNPPVKVAITPVTLDEAGFGSTYRLSDEALRQYSLGTFLQNAMQTYYRTKP